MKKQSYSILFAITLLVVLAASASVVARIALEESAGRKAARDNFARLGAILAPVHSAADLASPGIRADLARFFRASPKLLLVSVYERGSGVRWRIPARSDYLPASENISPIPQPSYPPQSAFLLAAALPADVTGKLAVDGLYVILPQSSVFEAFRDASLGLAAFVLLLLVILLGQAVADRGKARKPTAEQGVGTGQNAAFETGSQNVDECPEAAYNEACDEPSYRSLVDDDFDVPTLADAASPTAESTPGAPIGGAPGGLFSPLSGLGWESYLEHRLDAELARAASFEQDLSLLFVRYPGLSPDRREYRTMADAIADFFSFKDLAFERGSDGFAVILPNMDAEHGIRMAEEFKKKLRQIIMGTRETRGGPPLFIGLSSRAGRLVDSARVCQEAQTALGKAEADGETQIVAFRPDPDRYRLYLASKGI